MSLRQQQIAVFSGTVVVIFGLLGAGIWLIAQRLTAEATLQTALLMARQVEIALADSLRERPVIVQRQQQPQNTRSSFWGFLGNVFDGFRSDPASTTTTTRYSAPRQEDVRGLMRAFVERSASIEAMWVVNAEGQLLYTSVPGDSEKSPSTLTVLNKLRRSEPTRNTKAKTTITMSGCPCRCLRVCAARAGYGYGSIQPTGQDCFPAYGTS